MVKFVLVSVRSLQNVIWTHAGVVHWQMASLLLFGVYAAQTAVSLRIYMSWSISSRLYSVATFCISTLFTLIGVLSITITVVFALIISYPFA